MLYELGVSIKEHRKKCGLTQLQLAKQLNVSEAAVCKYESGSITPPLDTLCKMSSIFHVSLDELCGLGSTGSISVHGLTDGQKEILSRLVELFRYSDWKSSKFSPEQYEIIGKIIIEFTKK